MTARVWRCAIVAAIGLATACSSGPAPPAPTASRPGTGSGLPELTGRFVSPWYGYSVAFPTGWSPVVGKGPWPRGDVLFHGDPRLDSIEGTTAAGPARFVGASQSLPDGTTLEAFAGDAGPFSCPPGDRLPEPVAIDGVRALVTLDGCPSQAELGGLIWDVVVVDGGRGYDFTVDGEIDGADAANWFASIRLDPTASRP